MNDILSILLRIIFVVAGVPLGVGAAGLAIVALNLFALLLTASILVKFAYSVLFK
jgi:hypothetical protein